jgi:hypothetical protein
MARAKKATKTKRREAKRREANQVAESVGPERGSVSSIAPLDEERFILEEARHVREKIHPRLPKAEIVAAGLARAKGEPVGLPPRGPHGKSKVHERSANAYRKGLGRH